MSSSQVLLSLLLIGGYSVLSFFYVRIRFEWLKRSRKGERRKLGERRRTPRGVLDLSGVFTFGAAWVAAVFYFPDSGPWLVLAPLYALARMGAGAFWGGSNLPTMNLAFREMAHAAVFLLLLFFTWGTP